MDKEYLLSLVTTLKLTEKRITETREDMARWENRRVLALARGEADLAAAADQALVPLREKLTALEGEAAAYRREAAQVKEALPALAARERSIDPDLLEQELIILGGGIPGDEVQAASERAAEKVDALAREQTAEEALAALKVKMGLRPEPAPGEGNGTGLG
jgi:phage shock protein A